MAAIALDRPESLQYLAEREGLPASALTLTPLGGGVSNHVLLVETPRRRYVVKQSLGKLRVDADWRSRRDRIWREAAAMRALAALLPAGAVPEVLWEDRDNFVFAMSVAGGGRSWKSLLLGGETRPEIAARAARIQRALIDAGSTTLATDFEDQEVFDQLRLDPYYRYTAARHPDLAPLFEAAIARCRRVRAALVHGDWSPKNLMIDPDKVTAIDFEVIHWGDPAFDCAFLVNHLVLKRFYQPQHRLGYLRLIERYFQTLAADAEIERGTLEHLPLLLLARIDGKSPAEYIQDPELKQQIRAFARTLLRRSPDSIEALLGML